MGRLLLVVGVTAALVSSAPAHAAKVYPDPVRGLVYEAAPDEDNDVEISLVGAVYVVRELGPATLTPGPPPPEPQCVFVSPKEAHCGGTSPVFIEVTLGDMDDRATILSVDENMRPNYRVFGEAGNDTLTSFVGPSSGALSGGNGDDLLKGSGGSDSVAGGDGDDIVVYTADSLSGGPGGDTLDFGTTGDSWTIDLAAGTVQGFSTIDTTFENVLTGSGDDVLRGNDAANRLDGGGGNDLVDGRLGPDTFVGGDGFDIADYSDRTEDVTIVPWPSITSGGASDGAGDSIHADVEGGFGGDGDDRYLGNDAANLFNGGFGADEYTGSVGFDVVDYSDRATGVTVNLDGTASSGNDDDGPPGQRDLVSPDVEDIVGGEGDDTLVGNAADNFFDGGFGADTMDGGLGDDLVDYSGRGLGVIVILDGSPRSGNDFDGPGGGRDALHSIEDALGGAGYDVFFGSAAPNVFLGGAGNDELLGEGGEDLLSGDSGNDTIRSRDGAVDDVSCGEHYDTAEVERADVVSADCETIDQGPPTVGPTATRDITSNGVTLTSFFNPNRRPAGAWFQLGTTMAYGTNTFAIGPVNGNDDVPVTVQVKGLFPSTTYHVRLVAQNAPGYAAYGPDTTFTTASVPTRPPLLPVRCIVPKLKGKSLTAARRALRRANCRVGKITRAYSRTVPKGRIFRQSRRPGARLPNGAKVGVVVSRGKKPRARPRPR